MTDYTYDDPYYVPGAPGRDAAVSPDDVSPAPFPSSPSPTLSLDVSRFPSPEGFPSDGFGGGEDGWAGAAEGKAGGGNDGPWLPGEWDVEPAAGEGLRRRPRQAPPAVARTRERILGSGLAAEFRDPRPASLGAHRAYIATHKYRPEGAPGIAFAAFYGLATFPFKITGKAMTHGGTAVAQAGRRVDRAGDRFIFVFMPFAFFIAIAIIFWAFS